jgi:glycosyltransferase involved in cell wall biosynthesis
MYQYQQLALESLAQLPDKLDVSVYYSNPDLAHLAKEFTRFHWHAIRPLWWWEGFLAVVGRRILPRALLRRWQPLTWALGDAPPDLLLYTSPCVQSFEVGVPYVMAVHDLQHRLQPHFPEVSAMGEFARREYIYNAGCREAAGILVDSEVGKGHVVDLYGADPAKVHPLPYVAPSYIDSPDLKCLRHFKLPEKYIFYPAQFWKHKNHENLLRALALLKKKGLTVPAVFTGSRKNGYADVMRLSEELGLTPQLSFLGYTSDRETVALYTAARALVMPTYFGPTNIPPLEAFVLGCPVVTSDVPGAYEQLGDAAILVPPADPAAIAGAVERIWTDDGLCRELVERGKKRVSSWTRADFAARLCQVIQSTLVRVAKRSGPGV